MKKISTLLLGVGIIFTMSTFIQADEVVAKIGPSINAASPVASTCDAAITFAGMGYNDVTGVYADQEYGFYTYIDIDAIPETYQGNENTIGLVKKLNTGPNSHDGLIYFIFPENSGNLEQNIFGAYAVQEGEGTDFTTVFNRNATIDEANELGFGLSSGNAFELGDLEYFNINSQDSGAFGALWGNNDTDIYVIAYNCDSE